MDFKITVPLIALCLIVAFLGRYELVAVPAGGEGVTGYTYRLDRWTGGVLMIVGTNSSSVEIK